MVISSIDFDIERKVVGRGEAINISCEEVQKVLTESAINKKPPEDLEYQAVIVAHTLTCSACSEHFHKEMSRVSKDAKPN